MAMLHAFARAHRTATSGRAQEDFPGRLARCCTVRDGGGVILPRAYTFALLDDSSVNAARPMDERLLAVRASRNPRAPPLGAMIHAPLCQIRRGHPDARPLNRGNDIAPLPVGARFPQG